MAKSKRRNTKQHVHKVGDLVLAKMKGYRPWPAKVVAIPTPGNYKVKFFYTEETSKGSIELKSWDDSIRPPVTKDKNLLEAYKCCREEFEGVNRSTVEEANKVPIKPEKRSQRVKQGKVKVEPKLEALPTIEPELDPATESQQQIEPKITPELETRQEPEPELEPEPEFESEPTSSPEADVTDTRPPKRVRSPTPVKCEGNDKHARKLNANSVDCSLNDLTSEQANAERGVKRASSKSNLTHETIETKTIEKLKRKLQRKLDEKEIKKRNRTEKKIFDKASNIWQRKFIPKFLSMSQMCDHLVAKPGDQRNANQLVTSMKSFVDSKNLDLLNKCVEPLSSHYGRSQKESKDYHQAIERMVSCVKKVKQANLKPTSKEAKHLLSQLKANQSIKQFINSFTERTSEAKEEFIVERKENAQKRRKLTR